MDRVSGAGWRWYVKFLSGNDTLLNAAHQAGPYVSRPLVFSLFPTLAASGDLNPRRVFPVRIDSHSDETSATAIWYNNRVKGQGTRDECRITGWGGRRSPLLDPESTGSLCAFAFHQAEAKDADECRVWLCSSTEEEEELQGRIGPLEPGKPIVYDASGTSAQPLGRIDAPAGHPCRLEMAEIPYAWRAALPDPQELVELAINRLPLLRHSSPDERLLGRRDCEFRLFRALEDLVVLPRIRAVFESVDQFVDYANSVTNRRKSRSGISLELHTKALFDEERLGYSHDELSEGNKRPDFLFPSAAAYRDPAFPADRLHMLGVKSTCKDRWRQILNEADRVPRKHLLTLQEGVSLNQFQEMRTAGVVLVVPSGLHHAYHPNVRDNLMSLTAFIRDTKARCASR